MLFGLNVAGDLTVDIDMAAGDYIADEMHPAGDDRSLVFFAGDRFGFWLIAGGVAASDI